jgi:hypothetical protein
MKKSNLGINSVSSCTNCVKLSLTDDINLTDLIQIGLACK